MTCMPADPARFGQAGYAAIPAVLAPRSCRAISRRVSTSSISGGTRSLLGKPWCAALVQRLRRHPGIAALVPDGHVAIQCTYFEKSVSRNWAVPMHQDLSVPVAERVDGQGCSGWSRKEGLLFVQPPAELLAQLVVVRLHLDACGAADGPLKVVPGSHRSGRLDRHAIATARGATAEVTCTADAGAALVMGPLLLHASPKATGSSRRRLLHLVFGPRTPGHGLRWQQAV